MLCCCHADRGRFPVSFSPLLHRPWLSCMSCLSAACDAAELIICQQYLIRCAESVQILVWLRLFERLLSAQALCDVTEFHVMASHEEIILIYLYCTTAFVTEQAHRETRVHVGARLRLPPAARAWSLSPRLQVQLLSFPGFLFTAGDRDKESSYT